MFSCCGVHLLVTGKVLETKFCFALLTLKTNCLEWRQIFDLELLQVNLTFFERAALTSLPPAATWCHCKKFFMGFDTGIHRRFFPERLIGVTGFMQFDHES